MRVSKFLSVRHYSNEIGFAGVVAILGGIVSQKLLLITKGRVRDFYHLTMMVEKKMQIVFGGKYNTLIALTCE